VRIQLRRLRAHLVVEVHRFVVFIGDLLVAAAVVVAGRVLAEQESAQRLLRRWGRDGQQGSELIQNSLGQLVAVKRRGPFDIADLWVFRHQGVGVEPVVAGDPAGVQLAGLGVWREDEVADLHFVHEPVEHPGVPRCTLVAVRVAHRLHKLLPVAAGEITDRRPADRDQLLGDEVRGVSAATAGPHQPNRGHRRVHRHEAIWADPGQCTATAGQLP
jgi:hypothetical protein